MALCLPRTRRISAGVLVSRFSPSSRTRPPTMRPAGSGTRRTSDRHVTDLPEPDSPTSASVCPASSVKLTPSTALVTPRRVKKWVVRSSTSSSAISVRSSSALQLEVFVGSGEWPAGDEPETGLRHPRALGVDEAELPDGRVHRLVVHELLDPVQRRFAALAIQLARLLPEESVDVRIAAIDVRTARHHEVLQ